jgi:cell division protein FtsL
MINKEYLFLATTAAGIVFFHIYHESTRIRLSYEQQKLEQIFKESKLAVEEAELQVQALKSREASTKWALEHGMHDVKLSSIKKWQP